MRIFLSFIFLATAVILFFTETRANISDIQALRLENQQYQGALANSRELQTLKDKLLSQYNTVSQSDIARLSKLLPDQVDSSGLIVMLEDRAKVHGLLLKKIDVKQSQTASSEAVLGAPPPPYKTAGLAFTLSGPYASVLAFLTDLEQSLRLIDVRAIIFSSQTTDLYEYGISADTYFSSPVSASFAVAGGGGGAEEILNMLTKLKNIKINSDFFSSDVFKSLTDFTPSFEIPKEYGRPNPFAPLQAEAPLPVPKK